MTTTLGGSTRAPHTQLDDDALFDAWQRGDLEAANVLVRRHEAMVRRFLRRRIGGNVEDAAQNVWVAIARSHARFERRGPFRAYLLGVLRNQAFEVQRQLTRMRRHDPLHADDIVEHRANAEGVLESREADLRMNTALAVLPADARRIIELYYFERVTARMVGMQLGIGERTARSRVRRATERLRKALASKRAVVPLWIAQGESAMANSGSAMDAQRCG